MWNLSEFEFESGIDNQNLVKLVNYLKKSNIVHKVRFPFQKLSITVNLADVLHVDLHFRSAVMAWPCQKKQEMKIQKREMFSQVEKLLLLLLSEHLLIF